MKNLIWVIVELLLIFVLLSLPGNNFKVKTYWFQTLPIDKMVHIVLFASLALSIFSLFEYSHYQSLKTIRAKAFAMLFCIVFGIAMEYYQKYFVPTRGFEVTDMLADAAGTLLALPIFDKWRKRK